MNTNTSTPGSAFQLQQQQQQWEQADADLARWHSLPPMSMQQMQQMQQQQQSKNQKKSARKIETPRRVGLDTTAARAAANLRRQRQQVQQTQHQLPMRTVSNLMARVLAADAAERENPESSSEDEEEQLPITDLDSAVKYLQQDKNKAQLKKEKLSKQRMQKQQQVVAAARKKRIAAINKKKNEEKRAEEKRISNRSPELIAASQTQARMAQEKKFVQGPKQHTAKPDYYNTKQKNTGQGDSGQGRKTKVQIEKRMARQSWKKKPKNPPGGGKKTRSRKRTRRKKTRRKAKKRRGKTRKKNKR